MRIPFPFNRRCRIVQAELDRAIQCQNPFMSTKVLHGVDQRFAIAVLRRDLERELNRLLVLQVTEREKALEKYGKFTYIHVFTSRVSKKLTPPSRH